MRIVLCAGLQSSGSTWLYNVAAAILRRADGASAAQFYAEDIADFPALGDEIGRCAVKTHLPSPALQERARADRSPVLLSVREPRDAVASLMARFDQPFDGAARAVGDCAPYLVALEKAMPAMILRYEDRFYDRSETVDSVAGFLGVTLAPGAARDIHASLTPEKVGEALVELEQRGVFAPSLDPQQFDPVTHWHPRHVGDLKIGKHGEWLSPAQQASVLEATRLYCENFGYPADIANAEKR